MRIRREQFRPAMGRGRMAMHARREERFPGFAGEVFWRLENVRTGEVREGRVHNVVTYDASVLIARFVKTMASPIAHTCEPAFGAYALAVGTGDVGWDLQSPPVGTKSQRSLWNEIGRKEVQASNYVTLAGGVSGVPTNVVDLTTTFDESEAVGPIVEMGMIGGDVDTDMSVRNPILPPNGTYDPTVDVTGKDMLLNYISFPVLNKGPDDRLNWTWRYSF